MKSFVYWLAIVGLLAISAFFYGKQNKYRLELQECGANASVLSQRNHHKLSEYQELVLRQTQQYQAQLQLSEGLQRKVKEATKDDRGAVLIYRYPQHVCSSCVLEDLGLLKKFTEQSEVTPIVFVTYEDIRTEHIRISNELRGIPYIKVLQDELNLTKDGNEEERFFGKLAPDGSVRNVFLPARDYAALTNKYFDLHFNPNR